MRRRHVHGEVALALKSWYLSQERFQSKQQLAAELDIKPDTLRTYFAGRSFPDAERRPRLYKITRLSCFGPEAVLYREQRRPLPHGLRDLLIRAHRYIESQGYSLHSEDRLCEFAYRILDRAAQDGADRVESLTPERLVRLRLYGHLSNDRRALAFFGRFLLAEGFWSAEQSQKLTRLLRELYPRQQRGPKQRPGRQSAVFVRLVQKLALKGGLTSKQICNLRVSQIETEGIRLGPDRLLRFGAGWHEVPRELLDAWQREARPKDFLFYQCSPRNYEKPVSGLKLWAAVRSIRPEFTIRSLRNAHLWEDFRTASNLRAVRLHYKNFHGLGKTGSQVLFNKFLKQTKDFLVPEPYLPAVLAASRLLDCKPKVLEGGERATAKFPCLFNRYRVTVDWPLSFADSLKNAQKREKCARTLRRLAESFCRERWKLRSEKAKPIQSYERELLEKLRRTKVEVIDITNGVSWRGELFAPRNRWRSFSIPLIEALEGGPIYPRCSLCRHPRRQAIDQEVYLVLSRDRRPKGGLNLTAIARRYGISYHGLEVHAGLIPPRRYRGEEARSHLGSGKPAPTVRCPLRLPLQDLSEWHLIRYHERNSSCPNFLPS